MEANVMGEGIRLMVTLASATVISIIVVLVVHRMIEGVFPPAFGLTALGGLIFLLFNCVWPVHPALPGVILVTLIALTVLFPFAESKLAEMEFKEIDVAQLEKALAATQARPDNVSAQFDLAKRLYEAGFPHHAIAIGQRARSMIVERYDDVQNRTLRDTFRVEERMVSLWGEAKGAPIGTKCPDCGSSYAPGVLVCTRCQRNFVLDQARRPVNRNVLFGKLAIGLVAIACTIVGGASAGLASTGIMQLVSLGVTLGILAVVLYLLFGPTAKPKVPFAD